MHPLIGDLSNLSISELETKIFDLQKKYFMTDNTSLKLQIQCIMESYKETLNTKRSLELDRVLRNKNKEFNAIVKIE